MASTELPRHPGKKGLQKGLQKGPDDILSQAILSCRIPSTKRGVNSLPCSPGRWECKYLDRQIFTPLYRSRMAGYACLGVPSIRIRVTQAASVARLPRDVGGEPHNGLSQGIFSCRSRVRSDLPIQLQLSPFQLINFATDIPTSQPPHDGGYIWHPGNFDSCLSMLQQLPGCCCPCVNMQDARSCLAPSSVEHHLASCPDRDARFQPGIDCGKSKRARNIGYIDGSMDADTTGFHGARLGQRR